MHFTRRSRVTEGVQEMTDPHDHTTEAANGPDTVAQLIRSAGRRAGPPAAAYQRTLAAATATWQAKVRRRRRQRVFGAIAASLVLASTATLLATRLPREPAPIVGRTDRIIGTVELQTDGNWEALRNEVQSLAAGSHMRTRAGSRAGVVLASGVSVRLAEASDVVLESGSRVRVLTGKIYLDTGTHYRASVASAARRIEVITPVGTASDIGTQFEVQYRDEAYRLRVREGRVSLNRASGAIDSSAGEQLAIDVGGAVERTRIPAQTAEWEWVQSVAPAPDIDGQPVMVLLTWVARETGRSIRFDGPEARRRASTTILHGNIRHLGPLEALSVMLATTDLEHALRDDATILIRVKVTH